jgi:hypothetical protein
MQYRAFLITIIAILALSCGRDIGKGDKNSNGATNGSPNGATNGGSNGETSTTNGAPTGDCEDDEVPTDDGCAIAERQLQITVTVREDGPNDAVACGFDVLDVGKYEQTAQQGLIAEEGDCRVWETQNSDAEELGIRDIPIPVGIRVESGIFLELEDPVFDTCRWTDPDEADEYLEAGGTYGVSSDVTGLPEFETEITVPQAPGPSADIGASGDDFTFEWTPWESDRVAIYVRGGDHHITCRTSDDGELTIPGSLTGELSQGVDFASLRAQNVKILRPGNSELINLVGQVRYSYSL